MDKLKPCPFCGSDGTSDTGNGLPAASAGCVNQGCVLYMRYIDIATWNHRPVADKLQNEVDKLKNRLDDMEASRNRYQQRAWGAENEANQKWNIRRELGGLLGIDPNYEGDDITEAIDKIKAKDAENAALKARLAAVKEWTTNNDDLASDHHLPNCMQKACSLCDAMIKLGNVLSDTTPPLAVIEITPKIHMELGLAPDFLRRLTGAKYGDTIVVLGKEKP